MCFGHGFDSRLVHYLQCTHEVSALSTQALTDGVRKRLAQIFFRFINMNEFSFVFHFDFNLIFKDKHLFKFIEK